MKKPYLFRIIDDYYLKGERLLNIPLDGTPFLLIVGQDDRQMDVISRIKEAEVQWYSREIDEWEIFEDGLQTPVYVYTLDKVIPFPTTNGQFMYMHPEYPKAYAFSRSLQEVLPLYLESLTND